MRAMLLVLLALVTALPAQAQGPSAADAWRPVRVFIGSWTGSRTGPGPALKVARQVEAASDNRHLVVSEKAAGRAQTWGTIAFDPTRGALVLRAHGERAGAPDLVLAPAEPEATRLVFASPAGSARAVRITYERVSWNELVERQEEGPADGPLTLVAETRFKRGAPKFAFNPVPKPVSEPSAAR
jgi:hypothetical protein